MLKHFFLFLTLVFTVFLTEIQALPTVDPELKQFIERYYEAWNTMKSENADSFYAKDDSLVFFDAAPLQYKGWQEYKVGAQKLFFDTTKTCKLIPNDDLQTHRYDNVAWITLTFHISAVMKDDTKMEIDLRQTSILEKRNGKWLIVHDHISAPLAQPASPAPK